ncbi:DNA polymerase-3 subunit epsilon [Naumannella halotolerans]|uniref:DNA polymerase-3 subunit epsilon n=1 Tax=Naumannella halotolerans TaxID=993414 RepID=A0A4R7J8B8_9ACTN|nr:DNA polymerase-3 subunit epsilon [Naumannella halotolerans]
MSDPMPSVHPVSSSALQPSFDDLGTPLSEATFCVVDLETTGSGADAEITEIGAVRVRAGQVTGEFQTLVRPTSPIPGLITVLTGITNRMTAEAPGLDSALPSFLQFAAGTVLVAHNAPFDTGFLRRACAALDHPWPGWTVLDTAALARQILIREEVGNCRLSSLARHFGSTITPDHRALTDARATVDVLHGLFERVGNLGVSTVEDLLEFSRKVTPQRRARRRLADGVPEAPGVYRFVREREDGSDEVLYVGTSVNLRRRVRSYFTASEKRRRIDEMVRLSTAVRTTVCCSALEAAVTELRLIHAYAPAYNRRSKHPRRQTWLKLTVEPFPRLSVVAAVREDGADYVGPFGNREAAREAACSLYDAFGIRRCTPRLSTRRPSTPCALAEMGRCSSPCDHTIDVEQYRRLIDRVRDCLRHDLGPVTEAANVRLRRLITEARFEEARTVRDRYDSLRRALLRVHRSSALARCREVVAAQPSEQGWQLHVIRYGRLAAAARTERGEDPLTAAVALQASAATVPPPLLPLSGGAVAESELVSDWLEQPGVRLIELSDDWCLPAGINRRLAVALPSSDPGSGGGDEESQSGDPAP